MLIKRKKKQKIKILIFLIKKLKNSLLKVFTKLLKIAKYK